ncbi:hypothetical protein K8I61_17210 [bacterium]|nr:hypothetical protein [bacterium]
MEYSDGFDGPDLSGKWKTELSDFGAGYETGAVEIAGGELRLAVNEAPESLPDASRRASVQFRHPVGRLDLTLRFTGDDFEESADGNQFAWFALRGTGPTFTQEQIGVLRDIGGGRSVVVYSWRGDTIIERRLADLAGYPLLVRVRRDAGRVQIWAGGELVSNVDDFPLEPAILGMAVVSDGEAAAAATFDDFEIEYDSPAGNFLWWLLPRALKKYPMAFTASGDLAFTPDGVTCLLQDVANILESPRGDFHAHPNLGAGVNDFLGEPDAGDAKSRLAGQIAASLKREGLAPRVKAGESRVTVKAISSDEIEIDTKIVATDGESVLPLNFVFRYGIDSLANIFAAPPSAPLTTAPVGEDGYAYPAFGRDFRMNRNDPADTQAKIDALPQFAMVQAAGREFDEQRAYIVEQRDAAILARATGASLDAVHGVNRDLKRKLIEGEEAFRERLVAEFGQKKKDGTVPGLTELLAFYGFAATVTEGYTVDGPADIPDLHWAELHVNMTAVADVEVTEEYLYRRVFRRRRAVRKVVWKTIAGDIRHFSEGRVWDGEGWHGEHGVFAAA